MGKRTKEKRKKKKIAGEFRVIAVETGKIVKFRRNGLEGLGKLLAKVFKEKFQEKVIMWEDVESLEMINDNLKLAIPYKKLQKLHPADLADILEELDAINRKKVFDSLDEDTAALDPKTSQEVMKITDEMVQRKHLTTMMITHKMSDALKYGNRLIMVQDGQIKLDVKGIEKQDLNKEQLLEAFA